MQQIEKDPLKYRWSNVKKLFNNYILSFYISQGNLYTQGKECAVVNQQCDWLFTIAENIFQNTNSQVYGWLTYAQVEY